MQYKIINKACYLIFYSTFILSVSLLITACPTPPEFEMVPSIEYESVEFSQRIDTSRSQPLIQDIISLTISFEDGDGDLGFRRNEFNPPYNFYDLILDEDGELILYGSSPELPPYNFYDYIILSDTTFNNTILNQDTVLIDFNERYFNIYVSFFVNWPGNEGFEEFEWGKEHPFYQTFHGRFPTFKPHDYGRPVNGSLTYNIRVYGFRYIFKDHPMYLEVYILDRAGNKSNIVKTDIFQMPPLE